MPRKTSTSDPKLSLSPNNVSHDHNGHSDTTGLDAATNQFSDLTIAHRGGKELSKNGLTSSSSSDEDDEDGDVLEKAGVEGIDLENTHVGKDGKAPIELLSQVRMD